MKYSFLPLWFVFLVLALPATGLFAARVVVTGSVTQTNAHLVKTSYEIGLMGYNEHKQEFPISKKGSFKLVFDVEDLKQVYITIDEQSTAFYIQPGDSFQISINYSHFDSSIVFAGRGCEKNNFLKTYTVRFMLAHAQDVYKQILVRGAVSFEFFCDSVFQAKQNFVSTYPNSSPISSEFYSKFKRDLIYENASDKLLYPELWAYLHSKKDTIPELPDSYLDFVKSLPLNNSDLVHDEQYFSYVRSVVEHYATDITSKTGIPLNLQEKVELARVLLKSDPLVLAYESHLTYNALRHDNFAVAEVAFKSYLQKNGENEYTPELKELYTQTKKISPGQAAPEFKLTDLDGKTHSLKEFKGKVIYLDFWASWCGPCLRELPFEKKIEKEYETKNIVFLYVSIDEDEASWKNAVVKNSIPGVHLIAPGFDHPVCKDYRVGGVPSYFLIDKEGVIISNTPSRPSDEAGLKKLLDQALGN